MDAQLNLNKFNSLNSLHPVTISHIVECGQYRPQNGQFRWCFGGVMWVIKVIYAQRCKGVFS